MHPDQLAEKLCVGAVAMIREMLPLINDVKRETIPARELTLALQCGGLDVYSGITANPELGAAADIQMSYPLEASVASGLIDDHYPDIQSYVERIHQQPAYQSALLKGGKYDYACSVSMLNQNLLHCRMQLKFN